MPIRRFCLFLALLTVAGSGAAAQHNLDEFFQEGKIRTLILSGRNNHDWRATTPFLRRILETAGRFDVRVVEEPSGLKLDTVLQYDLIVLDYNGPRWGHDAERAVGSAVRVGKGLVVVHGASYAFGNLPVLGDRHKKTKAVEKPWPDYADMTGASWTAGPPKTGHGPRHVFEVKFTDSEHPIAKGMPKSFLISDELYHNMALKPNINVLATAFDDPKYKGTGKNEPMLWTLEYGKGRVFHTALGHDVAAMQSAGFVTSFARGCEWAATGKVTVPEWFRVEPKRDDPVRVQLVVGGHAYEPSLYAAFENSPDIVVDVADPELAYRAGRLKRADVIVQYTMTPAASDQEKENLKAHLEAGKGLVVLHHAILNYQDWRWWAEDVVGGRYIQKGKGDNPSTFQHDVELVVEPVGEHPVTKGIPPMHIIDETYKGVWISPDVKVLMKTDHPAADGPLVWVGPYEKARVVHIMLGHDSKAHYHPHFQQLVRNAILWTAGREP